MSPLLQTKDVALCTSPHGAPITDANNIAEGAVLTLETVARVRGPSPGLLRLFRRACFLAMCLALLVALWRRAGGASFPRDL